MNIGIIGGADGPTSIYIAASSKGHYTLIALVVLLIAAVISIRLKKKRKH